MKRRRKISGVFRSFDALVDFRPIRGYVSTALKNGRNALDVRRRVFLGNPFIPPRVAFRRQRQTKSRSSRRSHPVEGCLPVQLLRIHETQTGDDDGAGGDESGKGLDENGGADGVPELESEGQCHSTDPRNPVGRR